MVRDEGSDVPLVGKEIDYMQIYLLTGKRYVKSIYIASILTAVVAAIGLFVTEVWGVTQKSLRKECGFTTAGIVELFAILATLVFLFLFHGVVANIMKKRVENVDDPDVTDRDKRALKNARLVIAIAGAVFLATLVVYAIGNPGVDMTPTPTNSSCLLEQPWFTAAMLLIPIAFCVYIWWRTNVEIYGIIEGYRASNSIISAQENTKEINRIISSARRDSKKVKDDAALVGDFEEDDVESAMRPKNVVVQQPQATGATNSMVMTAD